MAKVKIEAAGKTAKITLTGNSMGQEPERLSRLVVGAITSQMLYAGEDLPPELAEIFRPCLQRKKKDA